MRHLVFPLVCLILIFSPALSQANLNGSDVAHFNASASGGNFTSVDDSSTLAQGKFGLGVFADRAGNLSLLTSDHQKVSDSTTNSLTSGSLGFDLGVASWLQGGISATYLLARTLEDSGDGNIAKVGLQDLRAHLKARFFEYRGWNFAALALFGLNEMTNNPFAGRDVGPRLGVEFAVDKQLGRNLWAANVGYLVRGSPGVVTGAPYDPFGDQLIFSLGLSHHFAADQWRLIAEITGAQSVGSMNSTTGYKSSSSELSLGAKYDANAELSFLGGAAARAASGFLVPEYRLYLGARILFDLFDPPVTPAPTPAPVVVMTTPTPVPTPVVVAKKVESLEGPMPNFPGLNEEKIKKLAALDFDDIGLEYEFPVRRILPDDPEHATKPPLEVIRLSNFEFDFNSPVIRPQYHDLMDRIVRYLNANPIVVKIRVEGHTDSYGTETQNRKLSGARAEEVLRSLVNRGLNPKIMTIAAGYGASRPIASNGIASGRQINRRVEVRILRNLPESKGH